MSSEQLTIVYKLDTFRVDLALDGIQSVLSENGVPFSGFQLYGKPINLAEAIVQLRRAKRKTFNINGRGFEFDLSCVRNFQLDFLGIKSAVKERPVWDKWASRFIGNPDFVMAWLADVEYEYWQNAHDPLQYKTVGKPHDHLPKKSNGLPPPLEASIIDISGNPGRRLLCIGYYEAVGAVMWLGEPFWQLTVADKTSVEQEQWLRVSTPLPTVIRVETDERCFTTEKGSTGQLQRKLRSLLFPEPLG